jgi:hypothetical protein
VGSILVRTTHHIIEIQRLAVYLPLAGAGRKAIDLRDLRLYWVCHFVGSVGECGRSGGFLVAF